MAQQNQTASAAERKTAADFTDRASFDYDTAFSRNIGWLTESEQQLLRSKRVAIAGLGGVGGIHLITLARLGIGKFHLADFDRFDVANMNRQANAFMSTMGRPKAEVAADVARDINPEAELRVFERGLDDGNIDAFLKGVDLYVDGLDFFVMDMREKVYARAYELGIPCVVAGPLGTGAAFLYFMPGQMSFEEYFRLAGESENRKYIKFMLGLAPKGLHRPALVDPSRVNFAARQGPSTPMACQICAGVAATEAMKILLGRGSLKPAPYYHQFDPYGECYAIGRCPGGNANPVRRLKTALAERWIKGLIARARPAEHELPDDASITDKVMDAARWAPSGDNAQPWRFERRGDDRFRVRLLDHGDNVYQFAGGRPNLLALGGLLEAAAIRASVEGFSEESRLGKDEDGHYADVSLHRRRAAAPSLYARVLKSRSVDRGRFRRDPLTDGEKTLLANAAGAHFEVSWLEDKAEKRRMSALNAMATRLRLSLEECHHIHQEAVDTENTFSRTGLPIGSLGLDPLTTVAMRWMIKSWRRAKTMNDLLGGKHWAAWQMDRRPGMDCAAHAAIRWTVPKADRDAEDWVEAGRSMMRFWLEAERLGLVLQPEFAAICFAHYAKADAAFSTHRGAQRMAESILARFEHILGDPDEVTFLCRIGHPRRRPGKGRSLRRPMTHLIAADV